jgi:uncharacterized RmlC-like cupin family protein
MDLEREIQRAFMQDAALEDLEPRTKKSNPASHWPRAVMMERSAYLKEMARFSSGAASETVREFPGHRVMMLFRSRTGEAEIHARHADVFVVLAGAATLVTGGKLEGAREVEPGETRGTAIEGGTEQQLRPGDVAHVPAGVPHQILIAGEQIISCLMLKIEWREEENCPAGEKNLKKPR